MAKHLQLQFPRHAARTECFHLVRQKMRDSDSASKAVRHTALIHERESRARVR